MRARRCAAPGPVRRQRGAASVEFYVVSFFVLIPLIMAILQMGMFFIAKNTVNLATFAAARAGAASGGDRDQMQHAFAKAVSALYVAKGLRLSGSGGLDDVNNGNFETVISGSTAWAYGLGTKSPLSLDSMTILNPTAAAFSDFGVSNRAGGKIIPVSGLLTDNVVGGASRQTRADALLLKLEVHHCYEMIFPIIDALVSEVMFNPLWYNPLSRPIKDNACLAKHPSLDGRMVYGVPIVSQAVVRMTVPPLQGNFK